MGLGAFPTGAAGHLPTACIGKELSSLNLFCEHLMTSNSLKF